MIKLAQQAGEEQPASETRSGGDNEEESNQPSEESSVDDTKKDKDYVPPADWRDDGDDADSAAKRKFNEQKNAGDAGSWVLINFRSIKNKEEKLTDLLEKNKDVLIITETWIKNEKDKHKDQVLRDMLTEEYNFVQFTREEKPGGGVAILFKTLYKSKEINLISAKHFEYVAVELERTGYQPVLVIGVYCPPQTKFKDFQSEFESLLQDVSAKCKDGIILAGDFNIWFDKKFKDKYKYKYKYKIKFLSILNNNSLKQHVNSPTHKQGHTLDLVISRNGDVSDLSVRNDDIADHCSIYFNATPKPKHRKQSEAEENEDEDEPTKRLKNSEE